METLGGHQFGHLRVQLADHADYNAVLAYLHDRGISAKLASGDGRQSGQDEFAEISDFAAETGDFK